MAQLKTFTVTRTVQVRQYEPVVYSAVVEAEPDEAHAEVIRVAQSIVDMAVGDLRDPLAPASEKADLPF